MNDTRTYPRRSISLARNLTFRLYWLLPRLFFERKTCCRSDCRKRE